MYTRPISTHKNNHGLNDTQHIMRKTLSSQSFVNIMLLCKQMDIYNVFFTNRSNVNFILNYW